MRRDSSLGQIVAIIARRDAFLGASDARSGRGRPVAASYQRDAEAKPPGQRSNDASRAHLDVDLRGAPPSVLVRPSPSSTAGRRRTAILLSSAAVAACIVGVVSITADAGPGWTPSAGRTTVPPSPVVPANYSEIFGGKKCSTPATPRPSAERVAITAPRNGARAGTPDAAGDLAYEAIVGTAELAPDEKLWLFFYATHPCLYYDMGAADVAAGRWAHQIVLAAKQKGPFVLYAVVIGDQESRQLEAALRQAADEGVTSPGIYRLPPRAQASYITLTCCK